jgi:AraC-like DNA-binding protein
MKIEFTPCRHIQAGHFIKAFWQTAGNPLHRQEIILPKGVVEIIFNFSDPVQFNHTQKKFAPPCCFIQGMSSAPIFLRALPHQALFGVELRPLSLKKLLSIPCGEFLNAIIDLEAINNEFKQLWELLAEPNSFTDRVTITEQWMLKKISTVHPREMAVSSLLDDPIEAPGVAALASQLCYSPRQLHRKSKEFFGMSTEALIGYKRYIHALRLMHKSRETLTRIAYQCNYFDQAHFIREFREYTGLTPGEYRERKSHLPGHLFE